jgi:hypothetical protein
MIIEMMLILREYLDTNIAFNRAITIFKGFINPTDQTNYSSKLFMIINKIIESEE